LELDMSNDKFSGKDNYGRPKQEFIDKISDMNDEQLFKETKQYIWLSACANNNPRSDYHWMADATYQEWNNRNKLEKYTEAYEAVKKECGY
jgi:hypothetical protein